MKINLLPKKKAVWETTYKSFHIVALIALVFNMSSVGVFLTPNTALAAEKTPETAVDVVAEEVVAKPVVETATDKTDCAEGEKCEDTGTIQIKKFLDQDRDGVHDTNEALLPNWHFTIVNGAYSTQGATNSQGILTLLDMPLGTYQVTETLQDGWHNSTPLTQNAVVTLNNTTTLYFGNYFASESGLQNLLAGEGICYEDAWGYNTVANGVGLAEVSSGSFNLDVPENLYKAYIFWGGRYEGVNPGDNEIKLNGTTVTADATNIEQGSNPEWGWVGYYADVTSLVSVGNNNYTVTEVDVHDLYNDGAGILAVYKDSTIEPTQFAIKGGLDYAFHGFPDPMGPDTKVYTYTFDPAPYARTANTTLLVGDGEAGTSRGDNLWFKSSTGSAPTNLVNQAGASEIATNFMVQSDGPQWDTFSTTVTIPANATYASFQIESPEDQGDVSPYGESIAWHAQSLVIDQHCPGVCELEIKKSVNKTEAEPGDTLEYTLAYENVGTADCTGTGVKLYDDLDSKLTYNGIHSQDNDDHDITFEGNFNGTDPVANAHVVSPGESGYVTFQATITEDLKCGENVIPNESKIWSTETGNIPSNIVNTNVYKECYGSLKVIKSVDFGEATPDKWDFTVAGHGTQSPVEGQNYVIFTNLLAGSYSATESDLPGYHQVSSTCDNVQVTPGGQAVCEFHNTKDTFCKLEFTKSVDKENALPGDTLTYTINYQNIGDGNCTGTGVKVYDNLDDRLTYVDDSLNGTEYNGNGDGITLFEEFDGVNPIANAHVIVPGESGAISFQATITAEDLKCGETVIPNKAKVWSNETGYFSSNEVETTVYNECYGSLKVIKYVDEGNATPDMWDFTVAGYGTQSPAFGQDNVVFKLLPEGTYSATESNLPGYHQVSSTCNNVEVIAGQQAVCELHNTVDRYDIQGFKWNDLNGNGEWDQNEPGKSDWTINLNTVEGTPLQSTITSDKNLGYYEFTGVLPGIYQVCEEQGDGWYQTYPSENTGCHYIYLGPNADNEEMSYNFGNTAYGEISGAKFDDANTNGVWDIGEPGLEDWTIELRSSCSTVFADYDLVPDSVINLSDVSLFAEKYFLGDTLIDLNGDSAVNSFDLNCFKNKLGATPETMTVNPVIMTRTTDQSGYYEFSLLETGSYYVSEVQQTGWVQSLPGGNGMYGPIVITSGMVSIDNDFGNYHPVQKVPNISIVKDITNHNLVKGGFVDYKITYTNTGEVDLTNVYIVDNYPEQYLTIANTGGAVDNGNTLTWTIGNLAIGGTGSVTYRATIKDVTPANVDIINVATIYSDQTDPKSDDAKTVIPPVVEKKPILKITKDVNVQFANPNDTVKYTVVVSNVGDGAAINVILTDVLPEGLTYPEGGTTKTFALGNINPGASVTQTYDAVVGKDTKAGNYVNTASAKADNHSQVSDDATLEVRIPEVKGDATPELDITKTVNVEFTNPGDTISYTIVVKNIGDGEAINVILTDQLPEGFVYDGTEDVVKMWDLGNMAPDASKTITYAVNVLSNVTAGMYENIAVVGADNAENKSAMADVEVREIVVLGDVLPDTGTSALDYLYYLIGIATLIIGLWTIQRKNSDRSMGKQISTSQTLARKR
ncbi:MAG: SdrD B-like domain-containing protein [Patescibacteria group bacterium]